MAYYPKDMDKKVVLSMMRAGAGVIGCMAKPAQREDVCRRAEAALAECGRTQAVVPQPQHPSPARVAFSLVTNHEWEQLRWLMLLDHKLEAKAHPHACSVIRKKLAAAVTKDQFQTTQAMW